MSGLSYPCHGGSCLSKQISFVSPSQLKSNVISVDHHISQYATICQQLQAEVRRPL